ncbi:SMP-30/gluconolactonase/LRE family protein [Sorangium sp. So ce315]|uniref:SMP-30/gluconolactonase/LRE family protein n=1 Tax=Sorangium sp. So ce315 TaxID=3133299 RepID=UPI003F6309A6
MESDGMQLSLCGSPRSRDAAQRGARRAPLALVAALTALFGGCADDTGEAPSSGSGVEASAGSGTTGVGGAPASSSGGGDAGAGGTVAPGSGGGTASTGSGAGGDPNPAAGTGTGTGTGTGGGSGGGDPSAICPGGPYAADPMPASGRPQLVRGGFNYVEGPVWVAELGALFFSEIHRQSMNSPPLNGPRATIHKLTPPSTVETFIDNSGTNGLGIRRDGDLIACTHDTRSVSVFDLGSKERRPVAERHMGKRFNSPNDVVARSDGNVYFTDPSFELTGQPELPTAVYRVSPSGQVSVIDTMETPNGIALSPDEGVLYVGDFNSGRIRKYTLQPDGAVGPSSELVSNLMKADGMGVDCAGNLYVAWRDGVEIVSPSGARLRTIQGVGAASNVAFGGADRKTLYITAGSSLYAIEMNIPGYPY